MEKKVKKGIISKERLKRFFLVNLSIFLLAFTTHTFTKPNNFTLGGTTGIGIVLHSFAPQLNFAIMLFILNTIIIIIGFIFLGKIIGISSIYTVAMLSAMIYALEIVMPVHNTLTDDKLLELMFSIFLPGVAMSIILTSGGTSGGTEILARVIQKIFKIKLSVCLLAIDFSIALASFFIFDINIFLYSILGVSMKIFLLDLFIEAINVRKIVVITSEESEIIKDYIVSTLKRGATSHKAQGIYTKEDKEVITTILSRKQAAQLQAFIDDLDIAAFITMTNTSRVIGRGFKRVH
jgi:uncharacterized membrane-anchored protein YitT (DUF2179 family)